MIVWRPVSPEVSKMRQAQESAHLFLSVSIMRRGGFLFLAVLWVCPATAENLVQGPGFVLTDRDIMAELKYMPANMEHRTRSDPERLRQLVNDLYRQKAIAYAAEQTDLSTDPQVLYRLARVRELELTRIMLERQRDQAYARVPDLTARARDIYKTEREAVVLPERIRVRHILLRTGSDEERQKRRSEADALLERLRNGEDFAGLAKEISEDSGSAQKGGDLGFFTRGKMVKEFENAAFALKAPGDLSEVVETDFGLHILMLEQRQEERQQSFEEVKDVIVDNLAREWVEQEVEAWRKEVVSPERAEIDKATLDAFVKRIVESVAAPSASPAAGPQ